MYTILMNENKELITTKTVPLYQREKLVDQIQFIVPQIYKNLNIADCSVVFKYTDIGNVIHREILTSTMETYKETKYRFFLPVDTKLNQFAGEIIGSLVFYKINEETGQEENVLKTSEVIIPIIPVRGTEESEGVGAELAAMSVVIDKLKSDIADLQAVEHIELTEEEIQEAFDKLGV